MTTKKVPFGTTPTANRPQPATATMADQAKIEQWIENRGAAEPTKRLSIDLPKSLHARIKARCALRGVHMNDEITKLLDEHFPKEG